ncbi:hypothetical protein MUK42_35757 [Musa troglodytarum]|uniref:Uncharacterized protein n=1 Tax=Musa troglodytarum TaxID=320322 RepID=A0A9E7KYT9_9LILI|nr:hypothetical protein MUK42_35757 [Musa troglodytarum]
MASVVEVQKTEVRFSLCCSQQCTPLIWVEWSVHAFWKRQVGVVLILYWYVLQQHNHVLYPSPSNNAHPVCPAHRRGIAG